MEVFFITIISLVVSYSILRLTHMWLFDHSEKNQFIKYLFEPLFTIFILIVSDIAFTYVIDDSPKAIDVYRGNTKLSVTEIMKDNVVIQRDSVVIYK